MTRRSLTLAALLGLASLLGISAKPVHAQYGSRSYVPNTYADFPYNQGSLAYRPLGRNAYTRPRGWAPRRAYTPQYYAPQGGPYYQQAPRYYYYPQGAYRPY